MTEINNMYNRIDFQIGVTIRNLELNRWKEGEGIKQTPSSVNFENIIEMPLQWTVYDNSQVKSGVNMTHLNAQSLENKEMILNDYLLDITMRCGGNWNLSEKLYDEFR